MSAVAFTNNVFLGVVDENVVNDPKQTDLLDSMARIGPVVVPLSKAGAIVPRLSALTEIYILDDEPQGEEMSRNKLYDLLNQGAVRVITRDNSINSPGPVPLDRSILLLDFDETHILDTAYSKDYGVFTRDLVLTLKESHVNDVEATVKRLESIRKTFDKLTQSSKMLYVWMPGETNATTVEKFVKLVYHSESLSSVTPLYPLSALEVTGTYRPLDQVVSPESHKLSLESLFISKLRTDRGDGLYVTVPESVLNGHTTLGVVYSSKESLAMSLLKGEATYYSRSRKGLWRKGETSGALQRVIRILVDCDFDALKIQVAEYPGLARVEGFCHKPGPFSCFGHLKGLQALTSTLQRRKADVDAGTSVAGSYTYRLLTEPKLLQAKLIEEAHELAEAQDPDEVAAECADLLYFAMTKCAMHNVSRSDVDAVLDRRALRIIRRKGDAKKKYADQLGLSPEQAKGVEVPQQGRTEHAKDAEQKNAEPTQTTPSSSTPEFALTSHVYSELSPAQRQELTVRPIKKSSDITPIVQGILDGVSKNGDAGLREAIAKFDKCPTDPSFDLALSVPLDAAATKDLKPDVKAAIDQAYSNIKAFHQAQMDKESTITVETMPGVVCQRFPRAIERIGIYVPGGTAILPSTALMLAVPAQVAGCKQVVLATPPRPDGTISPEIAYIAGLAGVSHIVRAGGAHAVAALAFGTESVPKVDKILGPGNQFVTSAKMLVSNNSDARVAIDMPAGPSEVLVIADSSANPVFVASDLLSQAEHGADSQVVLITVGLDDSAIERIESALAAQAAALPRADIMKQSIAHSLLMRTDNVSDALDFSNAYAPEHLILHLHEANSLLPRITNAGSVFVGSFSPESCGDYASGTNHTLPTYGYARQYSGVSTLSFLKHITSQELTTDGLLKLGPVVESLAHAEGLDAHANAVTLRLNHLRGDTA